MRYCFLSLPGHSAIGFGSRTTGGTVRTTYYYIAIGTINSSGSIVGFGWTMSRGQGTLILDINTGINYLYLADAIVF